jgi:capsular exopolysaccharide synthesis family protein
MFGIESNRPAMSSRGALIAASDQIPMSRVPFDNEEGEGEGDIGPLFFLRVFLLWWKIVVPAGIVLAVLVVGLAVMFFKPSYRATAMLNIEDKQPYIVAKEDGSVASERFVQTQIELLRSRPVLEKVHLRTEVSSLPELQGKPDPVEHIQRNLSVTQVGKSELYLVSYVSHSSQTAADMVNFVIGEYLSLYDLEVYQRTHKIIEILEEEQQRREDSVERLRTSVLAMAKEVAEKNVNGVNQSVDLAKALLPLGQLRDSLTELDVEEEVLKAKVAAFKATEGADRTLNGSDSQGILQLALASDEKLQSLLSERTSLRASMKDLETRAVRVNVKEDAKYQQLESELSALNTEIRRRASMVRDNLTAESELNRELQKREDLATYERQLAEVVAKKEILTREYEQQLQKFQESGEKNVNLEFARAELEREEGVFEMIASRKLGLQTELRAPPRVSLKQAATPPTIPIERLPLKKLAVATAFSLVVPFGLVVLRELTVRRIASSDQLRSESRLRVLGELSRFPLQQVISNTNRLSRYAQHKLFLFAESVNALRMNLFLATESNRRQVIVVTSAVSGEGKTSVAVSLAVNIARTTQDKVLIIDADTRSPGVATLLGLQTDRGLCDLLSDSVPIDDVLCPTIDENVMVLPAGKLKTGPHRLFQENRIHELIESLQERFATIVIDTPPLLCCSESLLLSRFADAVLLCAMMNHSRTHQVRMVVERLADANCKLVGTVLSGVSTNWYAKKYGYVGKYSQPPEVF